MKTVKSSMYDGVSAISQRTWDSFAQKKIYFGHQSVGFDILNGVNEIIREEMATFKLNIKETASSRDFDNPVFAHARIGKNFNPFGKFGDFQKVMDSGVGNSVDMAFFKLCYADIDKNKDVAALFRKYVATIDYLSARYPQVRFLHCTVPLTVAEKGIKARIKRMIGRPLWDDADNIKREEINRLLIGKYGAAVFDLAGHESTAPDGTTASFTNDGVRYRYLVPEYARDEGHLNDRGKRVMGMQLLLFLAAQTANNNAEGNRV